MTVKTLVILMSVLKSIQTFLWSHQKLFGKVFTFTWSPVLPLFLINSNVFWIKSMEPAPTSYANFDLMLSKCSMILMFFCPIFLINNKMKMLFSENKSAYISFFLFFFFTCCIISQLESPVWSSWNYCLEFYVPWF